jgi:hypothetical protein
MDTYTALIIFAGLLVLETLAAQSWAAPYFRLGIPVYFIRASLDGPLDAAQAARALEARFTASPLHPSIRFKPIAPGQIALRERLFENRVGVRYLPVMHALVRLHPRQRLFTLTGNLNWSVLAALVYVLYRSFSDRSFLPVGLLILFFFGISYVFQAGVTARIGIAIREMLSP